MIKLIAWIYDFRVKEENSNKESLKELIGDVIISLKNIIKRDPPFKCIRVMYDGNLNPELD